MKERRNKQVQEQRKVLLGIVLKLFIFHELFFNMKKFEYICLWNFLKFFDEFFLIISIIYSWDRRNIQLP